MFQHQIGKGLSTWDLAMIEVHDEQRKQEEEEEEEEVPSGPLCPSANVSVFHASIL